MSRDSKEVRVARYTNSNGFAVAIAANLLSCDGNLTCWAAYIAGTDRTWHEEDAIEDTLTRGDMLSKADAHYYFPDLPMTKYWEY